MSKRRIIVLWLAAAFVLAMSAFSFAKVGDNHGADASASHKPTAIPSAEPTTGKDKDKDAAENESNESGERKLNHGFYVSSAAHCEDVDDGNGTTFTAPSDCETNGQAHGKYVSSVAKSDVGKPDKAHGGGGSGS
ncbi:MAG: hypothetical protein WAT66_10845 [Actinomycetota bacterium]